MRAEILDEQYLRARSKAQAAAETEAAILEAVERGLLDAEVFDDVSEVAVQRLLADAAARGSAESECHQIERAISHLTAAVAAGGELPSHIAELRKREARRRDCTA